MKEYLLGRCPYRSRPITSKLHGGGACLFNGATCVSSMDHHRHPPPPPPPPPPPSPPHHSPIFGGQEGVAIGGILTLE